MLLNVKVNNHLHTFLADSGSACDIISTDLFNELQSKVGKRIELKPVTKCYKAANRTIITFKGYFTCTISSTTTSINTHMFVMDLPPNSTPILGEKSLLRLGLIKYSKNGNFVQSISTFTKPKIICTDPDIVSRVDALHEKYKKLFSGIGCFKDYEIDLKLSDEARPFYHRSAPVPIHLKDAATKRIKEFVKAGLYVPVSANAQLKYVSALLVLDKGKNRVRLVGNYVPLNKFLYRSMYVPAPRVENFLDTMRGSKYYAILDLNDMYSQFRLSKKSQEMCTLSTHLGNFMPTRLCHGIKNAQDHADERLNCILAHVDRVVVNRDDCLLGCESLSSLADTYELVLKALHDNGLSLSPEKCKFGLTSVKYYGYIWNQNGCSPDPEKCRIIRESPPPKSQESLNSFLCMAMWNSRFIHRFSEIVLPLRTLALTSGLQNYNWGEVHEHAFQSLKNSLCENTLNNFFVKSRPTQLHVDAGMKSHSKSSPGCLAAVLTQLDVENNNYLPIQFASKTLTKVEVNYDQLTLESLAIAFGMNKFRIYLSGAPQFICYTDAKPLQILYGKIPPSTPPRILRHILSVQDLDYNVQYKPGKTNIADFASRNPASPSTDPNEFNPDPDMSIITDDLERFEHHLVQSIREHPQAVTINIIRDMTKFDSTIQFLMERLKKGDWKMHKKDSRLRQYYSLIHELSEIDGILFRGSTIIILPMTLWDIVVKKYHTIGHIGRSRLLSLIKENFYWPGMINTITLVTSSCSLCSQTKIDLRKEPYSVRPTPQRIFEEVLLDFKDIPSLGYYCLVFLDVLSRFPDVAFVKSTSMESIRLPLIRFQATYGHAISYRTDRGPPWNSMAFADFVAAAGIYHHKNTQLHPESLAELERLNSVIDKAFQRSRIEKSNWQESIIQAIKAYRMTPHPVLKRSPYEIVFKRKMNIGVVVTAPEIFDEMASARKMELSVAEKLYLSKQRRKEIHDKGHNVKPHEFRVGDKCWVLLSFSSKSKKRYEPDLYQITNIAHSQITAVNLSSNRSITRHSNHFKLFIPPYDTLPNPERNPPIPDELDDNHDHEEEIEDYSLDFNPGNNNPDPQAPPGNEPAQIPQQRRRQLRFHPQDQVREYDPNVAIGGRNDAHPNRMHTRSRGPPPPELPYILPSALENSPAVRRNISDIHQQHNQQQQSQNPTPRQS